MSGYADTLTVTVLQPPIVIQERTFCVCGLACEYVEKVFSGANSYENDNSSFLYKKLRASDAITIELQKRGRKVADLNDNTLGVYYSTFTNQTLYVNPHVPDLCVLRDSLRDYVQQFARGRQGVPRYHIRFDCG